MSHKKQLTILEFSRLTGIKCDNLRYYDRIGLLSPETRGENNYRYYARQQLNTAYLITGLRGLKVGIEDIKRYYVDCTPEKSLALFAQQDKVIQAEIKQLQETRLIMKIHTDMIQEALNHKDKPCFITTLPQEHIFLCPSIPKHMNHDEGGIFSYDYAEVNGINLGFPQGTMIAKEDVMNHHLVNEIRYYFKVARGGNATKPAGEYAVAYGKIDPWLPQALYEQLLDFIKEQSYTIIGNAYEEYPLSDFTNQNLDQQMVRIEIQISR